VSCPDAELTERRARAQRDVESLTMCGLSVGVVPPDKSTWQAMNFTYPYFERFIAGERKTFSQK
jgi:hypothetical protein